MKKLYIALIKTKKTNCIYNSDYACSDTCDDKELLIRIFPNEKIVYIEIDEEE